MAFDSKYRNCGRLEVSPDGYSVRVYYGTYSFDNLLAGSVGGRTVGAQWAGDSILVYKENGQVLRWSDFGTRVE